MKGKRDNKGKPRWSLVHYESMIPMIRALEWGADHYGVGNWQKGLDKKEILESTQRHLAALMDGQEIDKKTGLPHIGFLMANAMFYSYFSKKK